MFHYAWLLITRVKKSTYKEEKIDPVSWVSFKDFTAKLAIFCN